MTRTLYGTFDGEVLRFEEPLELAPHTRLRVTIESESEPEASQPKSFLDVVQGLKLDGPSDWSSRLHDHLYGHGDTGR